jgi:hypothetical protein
MTRLLKAVGIENAYTGATGGVHPARRFQSDGFFLARGRPLALLLVWCVGRSYRPCPVCAAVRVPRGDPEQ